MSSNKRNQMIDLISENLPETSIIRLKYDRDSLKEIKIK